MPGQVCPISIKVAPSWVYLGLDLAHIWARVARNLPAGVCRIWAKLGPEKLGLERGGISASSTCACPTVGSIGLHPRIWANFDPERR